MKRRRRIEALLFCFMGLVSFQSGLLADSTDPQGPAIRFDKLEHDFGRLDQGDVVKTVFIFRNTGNARLMVHRVRVSCGCTPAFTDSRYTEPGETGRISVTLDTQGKRGRLRKPITIYTNDKAKPEVSLFVLADVRVLVKLAPHIIYIEQARLGEVIRETVRLENKSGRPITITSVTSSRPEIEAILSKRAIPAEGQGSLAVTISIPKNAATHISGRVTLTTSHPKCPKINLPVYARVVGIKPRFPKAKNRLIIPGRMPAPEPKSLSQ